MQKPLKLGAFITVISLCLLLVAVLVTNKLFITMTSQVYQVNDAPVAVSQDATTVAHGSHLVHAVLGCTDCHDQDLAGKAVLQAPSVGFVGAANLTHPPRTTDQLVRAIRYGVKDDGKGVPLMPTAAYAGLSDADLGAVIAYLKTLTPVERQQPPARFGMWGRFLIASRRLVLMQSNAPLPTTPPPKAAVSPEYGAYLARIARCTSCHGEDLHGSTAPGAAGDISHGSLGAWHPTDFFRALRDGKTPEGKDLGAGMPWHRFAAMTDLELGALWAYLQGVP